MRTESIRRAALGCLVFLTVPAGAGAAPGAAPERAPKADTAPDPNRLVTEMCAYLKSLDRFSFRAEVTEDQVYTGGRKLQFGFSTQTFVQRPDRLRVNAAGDRLEKQFFLDGKTLTLFEPAAKLYASAPAAGDLEASLARADRELRVRVPLADLASPMLCEHMGKGQSHALYVGRSTVGGVETAHLAFDRADVQYQVWIATKGKPLPLKVLINQKRLPAAPQWTAVLSDWQTAPKLAAGLFTFTPPAGAKAVRFGPPQPIPAKAAGKPADQAAAPAVDKPATEPTGTAADPTAGQSAEKTDTPTPTPTGDKP